MKMIEVKTADLVGAALDLAVAQAAGWVAASIITVEAPSKRYFEIRSPSGIKLSPSTDWAQGGPLIEKYNIQTSYNGNGFPKSPTGKYWCAYVSKPHGQEERPSGGGPTVLIAAMRAIVAAKLGYTVSVPAELLTSS